MNTEQWEKIKRLVHELVANADFYKDQYDAMELFMFLVQWLMSFREYSGVLSQKALLKTVDGLEDRLQGYRDMYAENNPFWVTADPSTPLPDGELGTLLQLLAEQDAVNQKRWEELTRGK